MTTTDEGLALDLDTLTIGEAERLEDAAGAPLSELFVEGRAPSAKALRAVAWVALLRRNPEASWEDAGAVTLNSLVGSLGLGGDESPT